MTIYLYSKNNDVQIFDTKDEAFNKLGTNFIANNVALYIGSAEENYYAFGHNRNLTTDAYRSLCSWGSQRRFGDFCLRNEYGDILTLVDFREQVLGNQKPYVSFWLRDWNGEGAVPGTGKRRRYGRYLRYPKTLNALKAADYYCEEDGEVPVRGKRRKGYVPTAWDDKPRKDWNFKNWKRQRKTQYKEKH